MNLNSNPEQRLSFSVLKPNKSKCVHINDKRLNKTL